jgi:hypothetical protein
VNINPVKVDLFGIFRHQMMGILVEYDNDVELRSCYCLVLKAEGVTRGDLDLLKDVKVVVSVSKVSGSRSAPRKGMLWSE